MFPEDSLQFSFDPWWITTDSAEIRRGDLILVHIPYINAQPFRLIPTGRSSPTSHGEADFRVEPHDAARPASMSALPVAGLPLSEREIFYAFRAKERPAIVLSTCGPPLASGDRAGTASWRTSPTLLVAPCSRATGFPRLEQRIRRCEWPQFMWNRLPISRDDSVVMMSQIQAIGRDHKAFRKTSFQLSETALEIMDDWLGWIMYGTLDADGDLFSFRELALTL